MGYHSNEEATKKAVNDACRFINDRERCAHSLDKCLDALKDLLADISGGDKSCGHEFTCVCAADKAKSTIAMIEGSP